jgi:hypothetical protein
MNIVRILGGALIGVIALYVVLTLIGAVIIGGLADRARREHERRHKADAGGWPRLGI